LAISFCAKDEQPYLKDIERLIKMSVKIEKEHPYPYTDVPENPDAKPDLRNKKKPEATNSRKSDASKKNKKRWY
jgi:ATP-dependent RNA helicase RhlE